MKLFLSRGRFGFATCAIAIGLASGIGVYLFKELIDLVTWLATGHSTFGEHGQAQVSSHLPFLGHIFFLVIPVVGGLIVGPLVTRFAPEAKGHGVPAVMVAVAARDGRIRPRVGLVKGIASAINIGTGGSLGREGPIVQIGAALGSSLGQWLRADANRMKILVACGAAGGIAATFNTPITGALFGVEIIIRAVSADAVFAILISTVTADAFIVLISGNTPFLTGFPHGVPLPHAWNYALVVVLAVVCAGAGQLFTYVLYGVEELCDRIWHGRPEWLRPVVGGVLVGVILLAVPEMYGVGFPVMFNAVDGKYTIVFLVILAAAKIIATSVTLGVGGSGGVFGPQLFVGVATGMAFGSIVHGIAGSGAGNPAIYAALGMGAVFAGASRAPLTAMACIIEMTGDYTIVLPAMIACAVATLVSRRISYRTIDTGKLLRDGIDIDKPHELLG